MAKYRKISPRIWSDAKFMSLSDDAQLLFIFVLTHPHLSSVGAMRATLPGLASEKNWPLERVSKGFGELFRKGLVKHDERASFMVATNFVKHNLPENPNVVKAWRNAFDEFPECPLFYWLFEHIKEVLKGFAKPFGEPFRKGLANQEQEQEQEQNKENTKEKSIENSLCTFPIPGTENLSEVRKKNLALKNQAIEVLDFLNLKVGRRYRGVDEKNIPTPNLKFIIARLQSGATAENCRQVIARKAREWLKTEGMASYLRPKTLFNATNFEQYLGELHFEPEGENRQIPETSNNEQHEDLDAYPRHHIKKEKIIEPSTSVGPRNLF